MVSCRCQVGIFVHSARRYFNLLLGKSEESTAFWTSDLKIYLLAKATNLINFSRLNFEPPFECSLFLLAFVRLSLRTSERRLYYIRLSPELFVAV